MSDARGNRRQRTPTWTLAALAAESGVAARTIRYYIARNLLPRPARGGRGAFYTEEHLARLREIRRLQRKGLMLGEISRMLGAGIEAVPEAEVFVRYKVAGDVVVEVPSGVAPWRLREIRAAIAEMAARLAADGRRNEP